MLGNRIVLVIRYIHPPGLRSRPLNVQENRGKILVPNPMTRTPPVGYTTKSKSFRCDRKVNEM